MNLEETQKVADVWKQNWLNRNNKPMDIFTKPGEKVIFVGYHGTPGQLENAKKYLSIGSVYTIETVEVRGYHTNIRLIGFPNNSFNSVMFSNI